VEERGLLLTVLTLCKDSCKPLMHSNINEFLKQCDECFANNFVYFFFSFTVLVPEPTGQIKKRRKDDVKVPVQLVKPVWALCQESCAF